MIYLYSPTILSFQKKVKAWAFKILASEAGLKTFRNRFQKGHYDYPLNIVVFEDNRKLGFFDKAYYTLGINKSLMYEANDGVLKNIIRHELAHCLTSILYNGNLSHASEYREVCRRFNWGPEVYHAYSNVKTDNESFTHLAHDKLISKVKKLLCLTSSSNAHEAESATMKANELLIRYNLKHIPLESEQEDNETCLKRVLSMRRKSAKLTCICDILRTFLVCPVFNYGVGITYLEVVGSRNNVELAEYVAHFLDRELETLWNHHKKNHPHLKGLKKKNSFFKGVSEGYVQKIKQNRHQSFQGNELAIIEKNLEKQVHTAYGGLRTVTSYECPPDAYSKELGQGAGRKLSIRKGLRGNSTALIGIRKGIT